MMARTLHRTCWVSQWLNLVPFDFLSLIIAFRFVKFAYTDFYEALHLFIVRLEYMLLNSVSIK